MAQTRLQWSNYLAAKVWTGSAIQILFVLVIVAMNGPPSLAGGAAKPKESKPEWMVEVRRLQDLVAERARWAKQVDPTKAYDVLLRSSSFRHQYDQFQSELQGKEVAWVLARNDIGQDLSTSRFFIEHSGGKHAHSDNVETHLRCYVGDETAARVQAVPADGSILCVGKIVDFDFFQDFLSIGVEATNVTVGTDEIEAWLERQEKRSK